MSCKNFTSIAWCLSLLVPGCVVAGEHRTTQRVPSADSLTTCMTGDWYRWQELDCIAQHDPVAGDDAFLVLMRLESLDGVPAEDYELSDWLAVSLANLAGVSVGPSSLHPWCAVDEEGEETEAVCSMAIDKYVVYLSDWLDLPVDHPGLLAWQNELLSRGVTELDASHIPTLFELIFHQPVAWDVSYEHCEQESGDLSMALACQLYNNPLSIPPMLILPSGAVSEEEVADPVPPQNDNHGPNTKDKTCPCDVEIETKNGNKQNLQGAQEVWTQTNKNQPDTNHVKIKGIPDGPFGKDDKDLPPADGLKVRIKEKDGSEHQWEYSKHYKKWQKQKRPKGLPGFGMLEEFLFQMQGVMIHP